MDAQFPLAPLTSISLQSCHCSHGYGLANGAFSAIAGGLITFVLEKLSMYFIARRRPPNQAATAEHATPLEVDVELAVVHPKGS